MSKPNILVIITDQQNSKMMSNTGNKYLNTPNMDRLARCGVKFNKTYCANPVCMASRFSMLSGLYPSVTGQKSNDYKNEITGPIPERIFENGLGKLLKENGYKAIYGGKEHLPYFNSQDLGFDYICKDEREELAQVCAKTILDSDDKPFCMFASFINPHDICMMAMRDFAKQADNAFDAFLVDICKKECSELEKIKDYVKTLDSEEFFSRICPPLPDNYQVADDEPEAISFLQNQRGFKKLARANYTDNDWRMHRYAYARLTEQVDSQIGVLLNALDQKRIWDNTVIIFTSDHGDMDSSHKMEHKTALYEESTHVPFIIKDCSNNHGESYALINNGTDLIPTILDYAGINPINYLSGISAKKCVEDINFRPRTHMLVESEFGKMTVAQNSILQIYDEGKNKEQFFDMTINSGQMYNQICDEKYKDEIDKHRDFLKKTT